MLEDYQTPSYLCGCCLRKLQYRQGFNVIDRYNKLKNIFEINNMKSESDWITNRLKYITDNVSNYKLVGVENTINDKIDLKRKICNDIVDRELDNELIISKESRDSKSKKNIRKDINNNIEQINVNHIDVCINNNNNNIDHIDNNNNLILNEIFSSNPNVCDNMGHSCFLTFTNDSSNSIESVDVKMWDTLIDCIQV